MPETLPLAKVGEILTTTIEYRQRGGKLADNITRHTFLMEKMSEMADPVDGGTSITEALSVALNPSWGWFRGSQAINIQPRGTSTLANYEWKENGLAIVVTQRELDVNSGRQAVRNIVRDRVMNAEVTQKEQMARAIWGTGMEDGGLALGGIGLCISESGGGMVGGIDETFMPRWKNVVISMVAEGAGVNPATIAKYLGVLITKTTRNTDRPDVIVTTDDLWEIFNRSQQGIQRQTSSRRSNRGYQKLHYRNIPVDYDYHAPAGRAFAVNCKHLRLRPHSNRNFRRIGGPRMPENQLSTVQLMSWMGNVTMRLRELQGVLIAHN